VILLLTLGAVFKNENQVEWLRTININALLGTNAPVDGYPPKRNPNFVDRWIVIGLKSDGTVIWKEGDK